MPEVCAVCDKPVKRVPSGTVCENGHGGAPTKIVAPGWGSAACLHPPTEPIPPGHRGQAMAIAAWAMNVLGDWPVRLVWCVDLHRDVGPDADNPLDPSNPTGPDGTVTQWGQYLVRFRDALNRQAWGPQQCNLSMVVRYRTGSTGRAVECVFEIPWHVNLCVMGRAGPPVGVWRLLWEPQRAINERYGNRPAHNPFEGDTMPDTFWLDGIPF